MISGSWQSDTGGYTVEVYVPSTGQHCQMPDLPDWRRQHSQDFQTVCGGFIFGTKTSCITLTEDGWESTTTLLESR